MIKYTDLRYSFELGDFVINTIRDVAVIDSNEAIVQAVTMRIVIAKGKYILNPNLGSELYSLTQEKLTSTTTDRIKSIILNAIKPEIDAGNIKPEITVDTKRTTDGVQVKTTITLSDGDKRQINLTIQ